MQKVLLILPIGNNLMQKIKSKTICLTMIVKNEAHVIKRCLNSVKKFIDFWIIIDTGSTDNTKELIREVLVGIPGALHERPWKNFAFNRNESLELAYNKAEYLLILDADEELYCSENFAFPDLNHIAYEIMLETRQEKFYRAQLLKNLPTWRYNNIIHELLNLPKNEYIPKLNNIKIISHNDSARNQNPDKYKVDLQILKQGLKEEPHNLYYMLHISQHYFHQKQFYLSLYYTERVIEKLAEKKIDNELMFYRWYCLYQIAQIKLAIKTQWHKVLSMYLKTYGYSSWHPAPLYMLGKHYFAKKNFYTAYIFLKEAISIAKTADIGFLHKDIYYLTRIKFIFCAIKIGKISEAIKINYGLFIDTSLPIDLKEMVNANYKILKSNQTYA